MNIDVRTLSMVLDSWNKPIVFVDTDHTIRYMNGPAKRHYSKWGDVVGNSIFECHNEHSRAIIEHAYRTLLEGAREVLIVNSRRHRVYMRSVRDEKGMMVGYFERYDSPLHHDADGEPYKDNP